MDPALIALIGTFVGGPVAMKIVDWLLMRNQRKEDHDRKIRDELRGDLERAKQEAAVIKEQMKEVEAELNKWKERYFEELEETWRGRAGEVEKE